MFAEVDEILYFVLCEFHPFSDKFHATINLIVAEY